MLADKDVWHSTQELRLVRARYADTLQAIDWLADYLATRGYNRQSAQVLWYGKSMAHSAEAHLDAIADKDSITPERSACPPGAEKSSGANGHGTPAATGSTADEKGTPHKAPDPMMAGPELDAAFKQEVESFDRRLSDMIALGDFYSLGGNEQAWEVAVKFLREAKAFALAAAQQRQFAFSKLRAAENVLKGCTNP